jgi:hypothetical protein
MDSSAGYSVAIVGATGAVGAEFSSVTALFIGIGALGG